MIDLKKVIIILFIISLSIIFFKKDHEILIPNNAIRFRVIANSNSLEDQNLKKDIKNKVEKDIYNLIGNINTKEGVKKAINDNMDKINEILKKYNIEYKVDYGYNYFPTKNYKGVLYKAGNYESLVITLGEGMGDNFWCVLFPPLCLLDNTSQDTSEVEYKLYVKELLKMF